ncbi:hypothetical protein JGU71_28355 [Antrihabitans sp. YC3-6]|uniref:Uncharacterized protein n=1 Tax=Antrihabitans stalagmiti TaxID=2799499 RepID=A0A934U6S0_9NOCA|nr:hypothetical protein [Antrihabitans stalagmiti]MBJ8342809.1 hypothetical protein [Antrihabitans stalagmiti]
MSETLRVQVVVDTDELRHWAGKHADSGHAGVANVLYEAAKRYESGDTDTSLEVLRIRLESLASTAVVEDLWPSIRTHARTVFDKAFARGRAVEVESRKALNHG